MTVLLQFVPLVAIICLCVLLVVAASGCGINSPAWRGFDSGYNSQLGQPDDAERSANAAN
jgi:hypothetical protein